MSTKVWTCRCYFLIILSLFRIGHKQWALHLLRMNGVHVPSIAAGPPRKRAFCLHWICSSLKTYEWKHFNKTMHTHSTAGDDTNTKQHQQILRLGRADRREWGLGGDAQDVTSGDVGPCLEFQGQCPALSCYGVFEHYRWFYFPSRSFLLFFQCPELPTFNQLTWSMNCGY